MIADIFETNLFVEYRDKNIYLIAKKNVEIIMIYVFVLKNIIQFVIGVVKNIAILVWQDVLVFKVGS